MKRIIYLILVLVSLSSIYAEKLQVDPARDLFQSGVLLYSEANKSEKEVLKRKKLKQSKKWFARYVESFPAHKDRLQALSYLANISLKLNNEKEAAKWFQAIRNSENSGKLGSKAAAYLGEKAFRRKAYQDAVEQFNYILENESVTGNESRLHYLLGISYTNLEQSDLAKASFQKVLEAGEEKYKGHSALLLGQFSLREKELPDALQLFQLAKQSTQGKNYQKALTALASTAFQLKDYELAEKSYREILQSSELEKEHGLAAFVLMDLAWQNENFEELVRYREFPTKGLSKEVQTKRAYILAKSFDKLGNEPQAQQYYREIISLEGGSKMAFEASYLLIARNSNATGEELASFLNQFRPLRETAQYQTVLLKYAEALYSGERYKDAIQYYEEIIPELLNLENQSIALYHHALASKKGSKVQAERLFQNFITQFPEDAKAPFAQYHLAEFWLENGEESKAQRAFETIVADASSASLSKSSLKYLAGLYMEQKDFKASLGAYERLLLNYPEASLEERADWQFWAGYACLQLKETVSALAFFQQAKSKNAEKYEQEATRYLCLSLYELKREEELRKEVQRYTAARFQPALPEAIFLWLGSEAVKEERWDVAWKNFTNGIDLQNLSATNAVSLNQFILTGHHLEKSQTILPVIQYLLPKEKEDSYAKANLLYFKAHALWKSKGAKTAIPVSDEAIRMNPSGALKYQLLLLQAQLSDELQNPQDTKRLLYQLIEFTPSSESEVKKESIRLMLKLLKSEPQFDEKEVNRLEKALQALEN